jgi:hypothetical protein
MKRTNAKPVGGTKKKRISKFKAACLAAGLSTAWAAEADADQLFRASITPTESLRNAVIYYFNGVTSPHFFKLGLLPANETTVAYHNIHLPFPDTVWFDTSFRAPGYAIAGWYEGEDGPGVSISFSNNSPILGNNTWDEVFDTLLPFDPPQVYSEADVLAVLQNDGIPSGFFDAYNDYFVASIPKRLPYLVTYINHESNLINFSNADYGGTAIVEAVPEPSTLVLMVTAAGVLMVVARKRV